MFPLSATDFILTMAVGLLLMGLITLATGIFILITRAFGSNVKVIAEQTARLAQKGIAEDVAGLVGNASALLSTLNQMIMTAAGIGAFLIIVSFVLMGASYLLLMQLIK